MYIKPDWSVAEDGQRLEFLEFSKLGEFCIYVAKTRALIRFVRVPTVYFFSMNKKHHNIRLTFLQP